MAGILSYVGIIRLNLDLYLLEELARLNCSTFCDVLNKPIDVLSLWFWVRSMDSSDDSDFRWPDSSQATSLQGNSSQLNLKLVQIPGPP